MLSVHMLDNPAGSCAAKLFAAGFAIARQKIVSATDLRETLYQECLVRAHDGFGGYLPPLAFLDSIRDTGQLADFDLRMFCEVLARLAAAPDIVLGCNFSPTSLLAVGPQVMLLLERHAHLAPRLVLELTEDSSELTSPRLHSTLWAIRRLGVRVAVDDFGAGHSTPSALMNLPCDIVKIDKSLLKGVHFTSGKNSLDHIVGFAACFSPVVVVEGVETVEALDLVRASGASHVQGYLTGRPEVEGLSVVAPSRPY
jgi:EAL domain-containing protein (putative c-di-GMP-specific phosphodiesterase class I)